MFCLPGSRLASNPNFTPLPYLHVGGRRPWFVAAVCAALLLLGRVASADSDVRGLPFTRSYALEDIGYGARGARLDFDQFGRVAVIQDGIYSVLNDAVWLNIADHSEPGAVDMANVISASDGRMYYSGLASWGVAEIQADGRLHGVSMVPPNPPDWIRESTFSEIIPTDDGVYFVSSSGVAFHDFHRPDVQLFKCGRVSRAFRLGNRIYISAFNQELRYIDVGSGSLKSAAGTGLDSPVVVYATRLDETHALVSVLDGRLLVYDGKSTSLWPAQSPKVVAGKISTLQHLVDGGVAIGSVGNGLYLFSAQGELLLALDTPEYYRITAVANREPGVLWVATENSIEKVLYGSVLTGFGQRLGLTLTWPTVDRWNGRVFVVSEGKLYRVRDGGAPGAPDRFELYPSQPAGGAWSLSAYGPHMLVGGPDTVYSAEADGTLRQVAAVADLAHLEMIDAEHCYAIGRTEIAFLQWRDGTWREAAERTKGVSYPSVSHHVNKSVWIEMGGKVGRVSLQDGRVRLETFHNTTWTKKPWVNIGSVDKIVVLSGAQGERRFFDEESGTWCEAPELRKLLDRSPLWVERLEKDERGTIWATHDEGVIRFTRHDGDYEIDATSCALIYDRYPVVQVLNGGDVWVSASQALYHVERRWASSSRVAPMPVIVSMTDMRGNAELFTSERREQHAPLRLSFGNNNLNFRLYSGTDSWRRQPTYEYRLAEGDPWTLVTGSQLSFRGLHEGKYELQIRVAEAQPSADRVATAAFEILPPWQRTRAAYGLFGLVGLALLGGIVRWSIYLERRRNRELEKVVQERTRQLQRAMEKLGEETRNAATLAERDRMAGEIHDSVQQGLTGAILQLDTTLKLTEVATDIRARLDVLRNMLAYSRQELQATIWDTESPLLAGAGLADALRNLAVFASTHGTAVEVTVGGTPFPLEGQVNHNLLRIAQEATANAFRHADARQISIGLMFDKAVVSLEISDDGKGFNPETIPEAKIGHLGLKGIRSRAKRLSGRAWIESAPGRGAKIRVRVPVNEREI